jgi:hypothetical protein
MLIILGRKRKNKHNHFAEDLRKNVFSLKRGKKAMEPLWHLCKTVCLTLEVIKIIYEALHF